MTCNLSAGRGWRRKATILHSCCWGKTLSHWPDVARTLPSIRSWWHTNRDINFDVSSDVGVHIAKQITEQVLPDGVPQPHHSLRTCQSLIAGKAHHEHRAIRVGNIKRLVDEQGQGRGHSAVVRQLHPQRSTACIGNHAQMHTYKQSLSVLSPLTQEHGVGSHQSQCPGDHGCGAPLDRSQEASSKWPVHRTWSKHRRKTTQYQFPLFTYSPNNSTHTRCNTDGHKFWLSDAAENWNLCECSSFLCTVMWITVCLSDSAPLLHYSMDGHQTKYEYNSVVWNIKGRRKLTNESSATFHVQPKPHQTWIWALAPTLHALGCHLNPTHTSPPGYAHKHTFCNMTLLCISLRHLLNSACLFVYDDTFQTFSHSYAHTQWCNIIGHPVTHA